MALRDRLRRGLGARMVADGIWEPLAVALACASYPHREIAVRPIVSPKVAGQVIDRAILLHHNDASELLHRMQDPQAAARRRAEKLCRTLYGLSAADLLAQAYGPAAAVRWDPDWRPAAAGRRPPGSASGARRVERRRVAVGGGEVIFEKVDGGSVVVKARGLGARPDPALVERAKRALRDHQRSKGEAPWI